jgi:hypothetical protein
MAKLNFSIFLSSFFVAAGLAGTPPSAAYDLQACENMPSDAITKLPPPLRKWGQITCTPLGQTLGSREGWIWAALKDAGKVSIVAGSPSLAPDGPGEASYFTKIEVDELQKDERTRALTIFHHGMEFAEAGSRVYRVDVDIASGGDARVFFFDFGTFWGGMWCPGDECVAGTQFLIMAQENKEQITAAAIDARQVVAAL